jgi:hypothetical protein
MMDIPKVARLDPTQHTATIKALRDMADKLETGELQRVEFGVIAWYDAGGGLLTSHLGGSTDYFRVIGLLEMSKARMVDVLMGV